MKILLLILVMLLFHFGETRMKTYECVICLSVNHASRLHCQHCGTIPAMYSLIGSAAKPASHCWYIPVVAAFGCSRASQRRASRIHFRTVSATYYAPE